MRISTKGQVTIPFDIRDKLGLLPHTEVTMKLRGDKVLLEKKVQNSNDNMSRGNMIVSRMQGKGNVKMTTDEIMKLTRS